MECFNSLIEISMARETEREISRKHANKQRRKALADLPISSSYDIRQRERERETTVPTNGNSHHNAPRMLLFSGPRTPCFIKDESISHHARWSDIALIHIFLLLPLVSRFLWYIHVRMCLSRYLVWYAFCAILNKYIIKQ